LSHENQGEIKIRNVALIIGTRPQIIKSVPIIDSARTSDAIRLSIIHTGQHYDYEMSRAFFSQFKLPSPVANLEVGSGSHVEQIAEIMLRLNQHLLDSKPECVLVPGDTNSALAAAMTANKLSIPVAHVEAGARSYQPALPEEVNRVLIDHLSTFLFAPTATCARNLRLEGILQRRIVRTGDTMFDLFVRYRREIMHNRIVEEQGLSGKSFALMTVHRWNSIENDEVLSGIVSAILRLDDITFVLPLHPHTRAKLEEFGLFGELEDAGHVRMTEPVGYIETIRLAASARIVVTDSGGLQKEAFWVGTPCVTLREKTEWVETVKRGRNILAGTNERMIVASVRKASAHTKKMPMSANPFGDGRASNRIVSTIIA
jgi:UDP-N-acetylglucosamine 2-epimerase